MCTREAKERKKQVCLYGQIAEVLTTKIHKRSQLLVVIFIDSGEFSNFLSSFFSVENYGVFVAFPLLKVTFLPLFRKSFVLKSYEMDKLLLIIEMLGNESLISLLSHHFTIEILHYRSRIHSRQGFLSSKSYFAYCGISKLL